MTGPALPCSHLQVLLIYAPTIRVSFTVQTTLGVGLALQSSAAGEGLPATVAKNKKRGGYLSFVHATTWEMSGRAVSHDAHILRGGSLAIPTMCKTTLLSNADG